jgi:eukaryotic-like serine/threonine-protein kinase
MYEKQTMNACPSPRQLRQWLAECLSEAESQAIEAHVERCRDVCQPLLDSYSGFEDDDSSDAPPAAAPEMPPEAPAGETPAPQPANFPALPGYEILGELGRGGMGVVFKARHRRMDRLVAIKVLPGDLVQDAAAVSRFEREVKAAARLKHPNIVAAYDAAEAEGVHFLAMEYVEGTDLSAFVRRQGPLSIERAVDCVLQAAHGLAYAHRHGVVHRDIKPGNLLLDGEGVVKVLDMGLARFETALGADETELTGMGQIMGTVDYMSPEQALDTRHADARADIYALGMTLWYLLTGRSAYVGENALARLLAHREQPIPSLRAACPAASPELEAVFMKMVAKNPDDRYQTMADVIAALEDGLPRPSSKSAPWGDLPRSSSKDDGSPWGDLPRSLREADLGRSPHIVVAAPALEATVALQAGEVQTDPNTEQSLHLLVASAPRKPRRGGRYLAIAAALIGLAALAAAAFVIRVQTGEGEVIVESEVDGVSVDIVRNGEPIKEDWQLHAGADNRWLVRSGSVNVKLPANLQGEFMLAQDTARLVRAGKILVKITRTKKSDATTAAAEDRERAAAEWVLKNGGRVGYVDGQGKVAMIGSADDLPSTPFQVFNIVLFGVKTATSADLDRFIGLSRLGYLMLDETDIDATAISRLVKIPTLDGLGISGTRIKSSELAGLAPLPRLSQIRLKAGSQIDDNWSAVNRLPALRQLTLYEAKPDDVRGLSRIKRLSTVLLSDPDRDAVLSLQSANPLCRVLTSGGGAPYRPIGPDPESELAKRLLASHAEVLLGLAANGANASESDLAEGAPVFITSLTLPPELSLTDADLSCLSGTCSLFGFIANGSKGADRYATAISSNVSLGRMGFANSDLSDKGLDTMKTLAALVDLDVRGTKVTRAGVEALRKALPDCKIHWDAPRSTAPAIDRERAAAEWVLAQGGQVQLLLNGKWTALIERRDDLPAGHFQLIHAVLTGVATLGDDDLDRFTNLDALSILHLGGTPVGREAIGRISQMRALLSLNIGGTRIMTSELPALASLPRLQCLSISAKSQVDDQWAGLRPLESLRDLYVYEASAHDVRPLAEFKRLRTIWLPFAPADVAELQAANPLCRVLVGLNGAVTSIGRDPVAELAQRLLKKKARVEAFPFPPGTGPEVSASLEAEADAGRPFIIQKIQLAPDTALDDEEISLLRSPGSLGWFEAYGAVGADRYAVALAEQPLLSGIYIGGSDLTDAGLEYLKQLRSLRELGIKDTRVTSAGVETLRKALPDCKIHANPPAAAASSDAPAPDNK